MKHKIQKTFEILYDIAFNKKQYKKGFDIAGKLSDNCAANDKKARIIAASSSKYGSSALNKSLIYCLAWSMLLNLVVKLLQR